jgi:hypothetical protein
MEPDLILPSILERAVPALETLTETHRTIAIIKGLGAVSMGMVSRSMYYPGAKYIAPVLELLIPGIDLVRRPQILEQVCTQILRRMTLQRLSAHPRCSKTSDSLSNLETLPISINLTGMPMLKLPCHREHLVMAHYLARLAMPVAPRLR